MYNDCYESCFMCGDKKGLNIFHRQSDEYQHRFCNKCMRKYIENLLGNKLKTHKNIDMVFPEIVSCPVPMCNLNLEKEILSIIFKYEFTLAKNFYKLDQEYVLFKKSNTLVGSLHCINNTHLFEDKTFKLKITHQHNNRIKEFEHECNYCPCCYSYYSIYLAEYEIRYQKSKQSDGSMILT